MLCYSREMKDSFEFFYTGKHNYYCLEKKRDCHEGEKAYWMPGHFHFDIQGTGAYLSYGAKRNQNNSLYRIAILEINDINSGTYHCCEDDYCPALKEGFTKKVENL